MASAEEIWGKYSSRPWIRFYDEGVEAEIEVPVHPLHKILVDSAEKFPERTSLFFYGRSVTYRELYDSARRFAGFLVSRGLDKGDRVAIFLPNSPQFAIAYYGSLMAGATVTPMNVLYTPREISHQLKDSRARFLVALDLFKGKVEEADTSGVESIIWTGIQDYLPRLKALGFRLKERPPSVREDGVNRKFTRVISESRPLEGEPEIDPMEDIAALLYTGGTTGDPKGVMLTHYNLVANLYQIDTWFRPRERDVFIGVLPWFHSYGQTAVLNSGIKRGATIIVHARWNVEAVLSDIQKHKANIFHGVPTMYMAIINHPKARDYDLRSLEVCISGAAPLPVAVMQKFEEITGAKLREGYGLTETAPVTHVNPIMGRAKPGSIGLPVPNTMAAIAHPDKPELLPPGEVGEIVVSGPQVMKGYYNRPDENKLAFFTLHDRLWFRTGDMGYMDDDGYFYVVDRKKDLIKYKGYSVFPREVEEVLYKHECVREAAVIGVPDPEVGENIKAFIVPTEECRGRVSAEDIIEYARKELAPFKVPRIVEFREDLPKTAVGKVLRRALREEEIRKGEGRSS